MRTWPRSRASSPTGPRPQLRPRARARVALPRAGAAATTSGVRDAAATGRRPARARRGSRALRAASGATPQRAASPSSWTVGVPGGDLTIDGGWLRRPRSANARRGDHAGLRRGLPRARQPMTTWDPSQVESDNLRSTRRSSGRPRARRCTSSRSSRTSPTTSARASAFGIAGRLRRASPAMYDTWTPGHAASASRTRPTASPTSTGRCAPRPTATTTPTPPRPRHDRAGQATRRAEVHP